MLQYFNFSKPKNLKKNQVPDNRTNTSENIVNWQTDRSKKNDFPQQLLQNVYNSPVGSAAIDVWIEFVEGDGLLDKKAGTTIVNNKTKLTLDQLHALLGADLSSLDGCAFIQRYKPDGTKAEVLHLPFEETRIGIPNKNGDVERIYHNPYYGIKEFKPSETIWFYDYNPDPEHVRSQILEHQSNKKFVKEDGTVIVPFPGQAFWFSIEKPLARIYPQPFYYSSINWFQVDAEIQLFHERNIKNNLLLSVLINMHGDPSAPAGPQDDTKTTVNKTLDQADTVGGRMDLQMKSFVKEKGGVLINWFLKDEEKANFEAFPNNSNHDLFIALQNIVADQISIGTKVPRILLNIGQAGKLGDTQEIVNAVRVMQGVTRRKRNILKTIYERVFEFVTDGTIKNVNPVNIIPDLVWVSLTLEEQRNYIAENFDIELLGGEPVKPEEEIIIETNQNLLRERDTLKKLLNGR